MRLLGVTTLVLAVTVTVTVAAAGGRGPKLRDPHPCPFAGDFTCATLRVPLDYGGGTPRTLDLAVSTAANANAPRGVLLVLAGGPGQPAAASAPRVAAR